ncbi:MAG: hypothetical protein J5635_03600 [Paludibacteraceae bacterium]|nr:hypothetical protein [Paludibacteraceae bacterium]
MKKLILLVAAMMATVTMNAQSAFSGNMIEKDVWHYETNQDIIVERVKKNADENPKIDAGTKALVKMMAKTIVKNALKQQEQQAYLTAFPEGEYLTLMKIDAANNRSIAFTPELGRVFIKDGNTGRFVIAYPALKIALDITEPQNYQNNAIQESAKYTPVRDESEVQLIDGYRCIPNYSLVAYDSVGGDMIDTMTVDGVLMIKLPTPGWRFAEHNNLLKSQEMSNEYYTYQIDILLMKEAEINPANFVLPSDYKTFQKADQMIKQIMAAVKKGKLATPYDVNQLPDVIWDVVK